MSNQQARTIYIDTCAECGSATERTTTTLTYHLDGLSITVKNVPASVCPSCGEKYIPGAVGIAINRQVRNFTQSARENSVTEGSVVLSADYADTQLARVIT
jgi:YgiT-type zinc finger domain-containing protein